MNNNIISGKEMEQSPGYDSESFHKKHEYYTEYLYLKEELPHRYVFVLTNQCNLRCPFCYQKKERQNSILSKAEWFSILDQLPEYARVTLTGGEPLLHPDFQEIFSKVAEKFQCNIITNGLLLDEKTVDFLLSYENFSVLSISVDSIHKKIRPLSDEQIRHLEKICTYFLKKRSETGSKAILDLKTLILDENSEELLDIHSYCAEKIHCDHHTYQYLKGSPIQHSDEMYDFFDLSNSKNLHFYQESAKISNQLKIIQQSKIVGLTKTFLHPGVMSLMNEDDITKLEKLNYLNNWKDFFNPCKYPWSSIHINYDGTIFPCLSIAMGNLKINSLDEIIKSERFRNFKKMLHNEHLFEACYRCGWLKPKEE